MSVIAVKVTDTQITVAGDSILLSADLVRNNPKNFTKINKINNIVVGSVGNAQECALLWNYMETHLIIEPTIKDVLQFLVEFAKWKCDYDNSYEIKNSYVFAFKGHAFTSESLFVREITDFDAIGAGEPYAMTALHLGHSAEESVKVACELCCYVCEPILTYTISRDK